MCRGRRSRTLLRQTNFAKGFDLKCQAWHYSGTLLVGFVLVMYAAVFMLLSARTAVRRGGVPIATHLRVDVNQADAAFLCLLPGVGPQLAKRVVAHRRDNGPFEQIQDLGEVHQLGPKTLERIQALVVCGSER